MAGTREQADIERDIEVTREQLAQSIGELSGRLDPRRGIRTVAIVGVAAPPPPRPSWGSSSTGAGRAEMP